MSLSRQKEGVGSSFHACRDNNCGLGDVLEPCPIPQFLHRNDYYIMDTALWSRPYLSK